MTADEHCDDRVVRTGRGPWLGLLLAAAWATAYAADAGAANPAATPAAAPVASTATAFAKVGDTVISHTEFDAAFAQAARGKFYHGKPPENAVALLQREVGQAMVDEVLLLKEAQRRKLQPDHAAIKQTLDGYEQRYQASEQWKTNRDRLLPGLKAKLERDSLLDQIGKQVKNVGEPTPGQLEQYWQAHQDKFTAPEQVHLAMILLKVDPSSPQAKWDGARNEGAAVVRRLRAGADFKDLAQLHSGDESAQRGGDLGYVHRGVLPEPAQKAIDQLQPGQITDAVVLLEGVAVFRLEDRRASRLNALAAVRDRARELWQRDTGEQSWTDLLARLRRETPVTLDDSRFLPLTTAAGSGESAAPR